MYRSPSRICDTVSSSVHCPVNTPSGLSTSVTSRTAFPSGTSAPIVYRLMSAALAAAAGSSSVAIGGVLQAVLRFPWPTATHAAMRNAELHRRNVPHEDQVFAGGHPAEPRFGLV